MSNASRSPSRLHAGDVQTHRTAPDPLLGEALFRAVAERGSAAVLIVHDERIVYANPAAERFSAAPRGGLAGRAVIDLLNRAGASHAAPAHSYEALWHTDDDRERRVEVDDADLGDIEPGLRMIFAVDVTDRHLAREALRRREDELARLSRRWTVSEVAAGLAHELNQPLGAVAAYAGGALAKLKLHPPDLDGVAAALERSVEQVNRAGEIMRKLRRAVGGGPPGPRDAVAIGRLLQSIADLGGNMLGHLGARLAVGPFDPQLHIRADLVQMETVLLNLTRNAAEAMQDVPPAERVVRVDARVPADDPRRVELRVMDRGHGIREDDRARLFESFFTTKPDGMGMGLAICRAIVEAHDGRIRAEPGANGVGTVFVVELPLSSMDTP